MTRVRRWAHRLVEALLIVGSSRPAWRWPRSTLSIPVSCRCGHPPTDRSRGPRSGTTLVGIGDWVTGEGVPLLWPMSRRFAVLLVRTGGTGEHVVWLGLVAVNRMAWLSAKSRHQSLRSLEPYVAPNDAAVRALTDAHNPNPEDGATDEREKTMDA